MEEGGVAINQRAEVEGAMTINHVELPSSPDLPSHPEPTNEAIVEEVDSVPRPLSKDYSLANSQHNSSNSDSTAESSSIAAAVAVTEADATPVNGTGAIAAGKDHEKEESAEAFDEIKLEEVISNGAAATTPAPIPEMKTDDLPPPPVPEHAPIGISPIASNSSISSPPTPPPPEPVTHTRRSSIGSTTTISAPGSSSIVSGVLIVSSLELIAASKEAKKSKPLKDALDIALESLKNPLPSTSTGGSGTVDPLVIFTPLKLACETKSLPLMISALDCIGKLVAYDFFIDTTSNKVVNETNDEGEALPRVGEDVATLAELVTSTVCDCFSPSPASSTTSTATSAATTQHDTLLLRLLSCLLSLILSSALAVHQSALLRAVRTVYNVFLMGSAGTVQTVAQATLGQIVGGVFGRVSLEGGLKTGTSTPVDNGNSRTTRSTTGSVDGSIRGRKLDLSIVEQNGNEAENLARDDQSEVVTLVDEMIAVAEDDTRSAVSETVTITMYIYFSYSRRFLFSY
jgi:brefeldin A-inhibited guanine nucleotide-exchange protein